MTAINQLDEVLKYLNQLSIDAGTGKLTSYDTNRLDLQSGNEIHQGLLKKEITIESYELNLILFHLSRKEEYILEDLKRFGENLDNVPSFRILFTGKLFIESGGYEQQKKDKSTQRFLQSGEKFLIVLGAIGAFGYFILETWKYFHPYCCH